MLFGQLRVREVEVELEQHARQFSGGADRLECGVEAQPQVRLGFLRHGDVAHALRLRLLCKAGRIVAVKQSKDLTSGAG